jgi:hypothetical protein
MVYITHYHVVTHVLGVKVGVCWGEEYIYSFTLYVEWSYNMVCTQFVRLGRLLCSTPF